MKDFIQETNETYDLGLLASHLQRWRKSKALRSYYHSLWKRALKDAQRPILEIGSGICAIKEFYPEVVTSDLGGNQIADIAVDAYNVDQLDRIYPTILAVDVLHHLTQPISFLESCSRHLPESGRLILIEPAATPFATWFYRRFHHEPCLPEKIKQPYQLSADDTNGRYANMGMAWALFVRDRMETEKYLLKHSIAITHLCFFDFMAYPLTGGYSGPRCLPSFMIRFLLYGERYLPQMLLKKIGLRMMITLEKLKDR